MSRCLSLLRCAGSRPRPLLLLLLSTQWRITQVTSFSPSHPHFLLLLTAAPVAPPPSPQAPPLLGCSSHHSPVRPPLTDCSYTPRPPHSCSSSPQLVCDGAMCQKSSLSLSWLQLIRFTAVIRGDTYTHTHVHTLVHTLVRRLCEHASFI